MTQPLDTGYAKISRKNETSTSREKGVCDWDIGGRIWNVHAGTAVSWAGLGLIDASLSSSLNFIISLQSLSLSSIPARIRTLIASVSLHIHPVRYTGPLLDHAPTKYLPRLAQEILLPHCVIKLLPLAEAGEGLVLEA